SFSGNMLSISNGNTVSIPDSVNDADADPNNELQVLSISNDTLYLTSGGTAYLGNYANTDNQTLNLAGNVLSISNGNNVTLPDSVNDADADPNNELQALSFSNDTLYLSNGGMVYLGGLQVDNDWTVAGNTLYALPPGNVGIGQAVPISKLDVNGNVTVGAAYSGVSGAPGNGMIVQGNVGIGNPTPAQKLHVRGDSSTGGFVVNQTVNLNASNAGAMIYANVPITTGRALSYVYADHPGITIDALEVDQKGTGNILNLIGPAGDEMVVKSDGKVGIGFANPQERLDLNGDMYMNEVGTSTGLVIDNDGNGFASDIYFNDGNVGRWTLRSDGTNETGSNAGSNFNVIRRNDAGNPFSAMYIRRSDGNIGINNSNPAAMLDVSGTFKLVDGTQGAGRVLTSDAAGNASWQVASGGADSDWVISGNNQYSGVTGNVGIGTMTPSGKLDIRGGGALLNVIGDGTGSALAAVRSNSLSQRPGINMGRVGNESTWGVAHLGGIYSAFATPGDVVFGTYQTSDDLILTNTTGGDIRFGTNNGSETEKMTLTSAGRLGIGTAAPIANLHIDGTGTIGGRISSSNGAATMSIAGAAGNVRDMIWSTGTTSRWVMRAHSNAETGGDAGSDLFIQSRTDAGAGKDILMYFQRSSGLTGMGTTTPTAALDIVRSNSGIDLRVKNTTANADLILESSSNKQWDLFVDTNDEFGIYEVSTGGHALRIEPGGETGINTTNPSAMLSVN
ncbi:MAG: hypothetical protein AAF570_14170, partial [Bacteroidota bacterium]